MSPQPVNPHADEARCEKGAASPADAASRSGSGGAGVVPAAVLALVLQGEPGGGGASGLSPAFGPGGTSGGGSPGGEVDSVRAVCEAVSPWSDALEAVMAFVGASFEELETSAALRAEVSGLYRIWRASGEDRLAREEAFERETIAWQRRQGCPVPRHPFDSDADFDDEPETSDRDASDATRFGATRFGATRFRGRSGRSFDGRGESAPS